MMVMARAIANGKGLDGDRKWKEPRMMAIENVNVKSKGDIEGK